MRLTDFTHLLWEPLIPKNATIIDATCGSGHDTLYLAQKGKRLIAYDIQKSALEKTHLRLQENLPHTTHVELRLACHSTLQDRANFIVYNLGYLPGADKSITTQKETTLKSIEKALHLITTGGWISIMCYDGHPAGKEESAAIFDLCKKLDQRYFQVHLHRLWNSASGPKTLLIQKCRDLPNKIEGAASEALTAAR